MSQHLEDMARKIQLQEDINAYFKQLDELDKIVKTKKEWLKHTSFVELPQQSLASLKEACQVRSQPARVGKSSMASIDYVPSIHAALMMCRENP